MAKKRKLSKRKIILFIFNVFFLSTLTISMVNILTYHKDKEANNRIQQYILKNFVNVVKPIITDISVKQEYKYEINFNALKEQNSDTIAYIKVNNTNIDYVVVKGNNNSYYLKHNFEKKWNICGWIFADYHNRFDGTDKNIIIYGHNTKDGSMFDSLKNVLASSWYTNKENYEIILVTESGQYTYQVFSTYSIIPEDYYITTEFNSEDEFEEFVQTLKSRSNYDYEVDVTKDDKILTLSSCLGTGKRRVVLHSKLIENKVG